MSEREPKRLPFLSDAHHDAVANLVGRAAQLEHAIVSAAADCLREMPRTSKHLLHSGPTACCRFSPP